MLAAGFERFRVLEAAETVLCSPILCWGDTEPSRPGIESRGHDLVPLLSGLAPVESGSLQTKAIDDDSGGDHAKAGMRGILQMVTERRRRIFRSRLAVNVSHRPQRRLTNRA